MATVRATARSALDDIRSMIGVLRHGDEAETAPAAGTDRLDDLVSYLRGAGVEASLDARSYDSSRVPAHVDMALFGIAREAATNIVRHAGARTATLRLALEDGQARLVVEDDGRGSAPVPSPDPATAAARAGGGHGVAGMAERVHLLGGAFSAGPKAGGGFRVVASIPVRGTEA